MDMNTNMWDRLLTHLHELMIFAGVALLFGIINILSSIPRMPWRYNLITLLTGFVVGTLAGEVALEMDSPDFIAISITSVASLLSRNMITGLLNRQFLADLAKRAAENVVDKVTK